MKYIFKMKMLVFLLVFFIVNFTVIDNCNAQIKNYTSNRGIIKASDEQINIVVDTSKSTRAPSGAISFPGVIGSVVSLGISAGKAILSAQDEKYTSTYSGTCSGEKLIVVPSPYAGNQGFLNIDSVRIIRSMIFADLTNEVASEIVLVPIVQSSSGMFRFKIQRINLIASKAKIKKNKSGQLLDLSITIKLEAIYQESSGTLKEDSSAHNIGNNPSTSKDTNGFTFKTATLGESTIIVAALKPEGPAILQNDYFSNWFQPIPASAFKFANSKNKGGIGNFLISVTVKEANPSGISAKKLSDFFSATSPDINNLIKQFFPSTTK
jgi:hypothetical protein